METLDAPSRMPCLLLFAHACTHHVCCILRLLRMSNLHVFMLLYIDCCCMLSFLVYSEVGGEWKWLRVIPLPEAVYGKKQT